MTGKQVDLGLNHTVSEVVGHGRGARRIPRMIVGVHQDGKNQENLIVGAPLRFDHRSIAGDFIPS
jgi:hypothetical protein